MVETSDQANGDVAKYDETTQALLKRLGGRVGFDQRGRVNMIDLSGTLVTARQFRKLKEQLHGMKSLRALGAVRK